MAIVPAQLRQAEISSENLKPGMRVRILTKPYYSPSLSQMQRKTTGTIKHISASGCYVIRDGNREASRFRPTDIEPLEAT